MGAEFHRRLLQLATPEVLSGDWTNERQQVSKSPNVYGHRHDQVAMGHIAHTIGLKFTLPPQFFSYDRPDPPAETLILARGM
jgi:hypothetical protein